MTPADLWIEAGRLGIVLAGFALLALLIWIVEPSIRAILGGTNERKIRPRQPAQAERGGGADPAPVEPARRAKFG